MNHTDSQPQADQQPPALHKLALLGGAAAIVNLTGCGGQMTENLTTDQPLPLMKLK